MIFAISLAVIFATGLWRVVEVATRRHTQSSVQADELPVPIAFLGGAVIWMSIFQWMLGETGAPIGIAKSAPFILLCGGAISFTANGWCLRNAMKRSSHLQMGAHTATLLGSALIMYAAFDHIAFYTDHDRVGYVDADIATEADIHCAAGYAMVRLDAGSNTAIYRCPTAFVVGNVLEEPLVPWPHYSEGSSSSLATAIHRLNSSSVPLRTR